MRHIGNVDCDLILKNNQFYVIDINPRFGGGYAFTHLAGKNYLYKIISLVLNLKYNLKKKPKIITGIKGLALNYY